MDKIQSLDTLSKTLRLKKFKNKKIVLCHGVFDLLHIGHIKHFIQAKKFGDILVVTLTPDKYVNKGPGRPAFTEKLRLQAISSLEVVDFVSLNNLSSAVDSIKKIKPNVYCKGSDYQNHSDDLTGKIRQEVDAVKKVRGKVVYSKDITFSSSNLINKYSDILSRSQKNLVDKIKKKYNFEKIKRKINNLKNLNVLIIGETIIDQYNYCEALGKSGKEPIMTMRDLKIDEFLGGAAATANNLSQFSNRVTLLSSVGEKREYSKFIKSNLNKKIKSFFLSKKNSPTIIKKRYIDNTDGKINKLFGIYKINDQELSRKEEIFFINKLKILIKKADLVVALDYGHGLISNKVANFISRNSKMIVLNAQINSSNIGFHSLRKYKNIDCVVVNEREIRHELRDKFNKIDSLMKKLCKQQKINKLVVTRGSQGAVLFNNLKNKFYFCDAYAHSAIDKIGAGDVMLGMISLCLKEKFNEETSLLLSSLAAAKSTEMIANKETITKTYLLKSIENIFK